MSSLVLSRFSFLLREKETARNGNEGILVGKHVSLCSDLAGEPSACKSPKFRFHTGQMEILRLTWEGVIKERRSRSSSLSWQGVLL